MKKKDFVDKFDFGKFKNHLRVTFVKSKGDIIGYIEQDHIEPIPTTKEKIGRLYKYFVCSVSLKAYPTYKTHYARYKKHYGDPINVVSLFDDDFNYTKKGYTICGNESKSYVIGETYPSVCSYINLSDLRLKE